MKKMSLAIVSLTILTLLTLAQNPDNKPQLDLDKYQLGILKKGANWTAENTPEIQKIQEGHLANIFKMAKAGKLVAAGPMADEGEIRGIFIFKAASLEEARSLAEEDPAVKSGRLKLEILNWFAPKGIGAKLQEELKTNPNTKYTMTKYYLAFLKGGNRSVDSSSTEGQSLLMDHLSYVRKSMAARTIMTAGHFENKGDLHGILVIAANTDEEAMKIVEADTIVSRGYLTAEIHPWYVASEVWQ
ncbi:MAG: hypothetical protein J2P41_04685 [Blastocatellia bacterium]|nr:hypothetical protein [Blastocatellia bacterium]